MSRQLQVLVDRLRSLPAQRQQQLHQQLLGKSADQPERQELAGFVVASAGMDLDAGSLKEQLASQLPDYMVPARIEILQAMPRLPNGKADLAALRSLQPDLEIPSAETAVAANAVERQLMDIWCQVLQTDYVDPGDNFFELGGDSILSIQAVSMARQAGLAIQPGDLFDHATLRGLAAHIAQASTAVADGGAAASLHAAPLTPVQHWFIQSGTGNPHWWNQNRLFELLMPLSEQIMQAAVDALVQQHPALRTGFGESQGVWQQHIQDVQGQLETVHIPDAASVAEVVSAKAADIQSHFRLDTAPLVRFVWFRTAADTPDQLLVCAHHMVTDAVSWQFLLRDFDQICQALARNEKPGLQPVLATTLDWAQALDGLARETVFRDSLGWWNGLPLATTCDLPVSGLGTEGAARTRVSKLDSTTTTRLQGEVHQAWQTRMQDVLLAALAQTLADWTGRSQNSIGLEGHGREVLPGAPDVSETVGWLTSFYPVTLETAVTPEQTLQQTKDMLRSIPDNGLSYGVLRYLGQGIDAEADPQILFNYLGNQDQQPTWTLISEQPLNIAGQRDPGNRRAHILDINCSIRSGCLEVAWIYEPGAISDTLMTQLAENYIQALESLVDICMSRDKAGYTPTDFPEAGLDQEDLDAFIDSLDD